jgi:hypothetical protein
MGFKAVVSVLYIVDKGVYAAEVVSFFSFPTTIIRLGAVQDVIQALSIIKVRRSIIINRDDLTTLSTRLSIKISRISFEQGKLGYDQNKIMITGVLVRNVSCYYITNKLISRVHQTTKILA